MSPSYVTHALPGIGGRLRERHADFLVEEIPAYTPGGDGPHVFAWIEKDDLTTAEAVKRLARALGCAPADIGAAGQKDRHAITRQWLSLPPPLSPEQVLAVEVPGLRVLHAARHGNKLRTGHLRGNRFTLVVRGVEPSALEAAARARAILDVLVQAPGVPNFYGEQRFGAHGDNAARGRELLMGRGKGGARDGREQRFLLSALQSALFNHVLEARLAAGTYRQVLVGDVLAKVLTGGQFVSSDAAVDQPRLDAGEVVPTGPMFGSKMRAPAEGSASAAAEAAALAAFELDAAAFARSRHLEGTRRPLGVPFLEPPSVEPAAEATDTRSATDGIQAVVIPAIRLTFALPAGAYATVVAGEIMKKHVAESEVADTLPPVA